MPLIIFDALPGVLDTMQRDSLKGYLREACPRLFSVSERQLTEGSFGFGFPSYGDGTEFTHDVVMRLRLDAHPERLVLAPQSALELYENVIDTIIGADPQHKELRIGIYLDYGVSVTWCDENGVI